MTAHKASDPAQGKMMCYFSTHTCAISMSPVLTHYTCATLHDVLYLAHHNVLYHVC